MKCTIKIAKVDQEFTNSKIRAYASLVFDECFCVSDVRIIEGGKGLFISMPSYKTKSVDVHNNPVYQEYCYPITKAAREQLYKAILQAYETGNEIGMGTLSEMPYEIQMYKSHSNGIEAYGSIVLGKCFVISGIKVRTGKSGSFVCMPSKLRGSKYQDICYPITKEFREKLYGDIIALSKCAEEYQKEES